jgi:hypothetical protein
MRIEKPRTVKGRKEEWWSKHGPIQGIEGGNTKPKPCSIALNADFRKFILDINILFPPHLYPIIFGLPLKRILAHFGEQISTQRLNAKITSHIDSEPQRAERE